MNAVQKSLVKGDASFIISANAHNSKYRIGLIYLRGVPHPRQQSGVSNLGQRWFAESVPRAQRPFLVIHWVDIAAIEVCMAQPRPKYPIPITPLLHATYNGSRIRCGATTWNRGSDAFLESPVRWVANQKISESNRKKNQFETIDMISFLENPATNYIGNLGLCFHTT